MKTTLTAFALLIAILTHAQFNSDSIIKAAKNYLTKKAAEKSIPLKISVLKIAKIDTIGERAFDSIAQISTRNKIAANIIFVDKLRKLFATQIELIKVSQELKKPYSTIIKHRDKSIAYATELNKLEAIGRELEQIDSILTASLTASEYGNKIYYCVTFIGTCTIQQQRREINRYIIFNQSMMAEDLD